MCQNAEGEKKKKENKTALKCLLNSDLAKIYKYSDFNGIDAIICVCAH